MGSLCPTGTDQRPRRGEDAIDRLAEVERSDAVAKLTINQSLFEIDFEELEILRFVSWFFLTDSFVSSIGAGGSDAVIFKALWQENTVAVCFVPTNTDLPLHAQFKAFKLHDFLSQARFAEFEKEVAILGSLSHPNLIAFFGATLNPPRVGILMEFCSNGDLRAYLMPDTDFSSCPLDDRVRILREVASGMKYLHGRNIMHRDLKPENVLLDESFHAKLIDFGLSRTIDARNELKTQRVGTSHYMAPEIVTTGTYDARIDIFSFSIMAFEVLTGNFAPFGDGSEFAIEIRIAQDEQCRPAWEGYEERVPPKFVEMVSRGWAHLADDRPSFAEILACLKGKLEFDPREMKGKGMGMGKGKGKGGPDVPVKQVTEPEPVSVKAEVQVVASTPAPAPVPAPAPAVVTSPIRTQPLDADLKPHTPSVEEEEEGEDRPVDVDVAYHGPQTIPFGVIPSSLEEFMALRDAHETRLEQAETDLDLLPYRRACLGSAFYALSLLVYVERGPEVGLECVAQCCDAKLLKEGSLIPSAVTVLRHLDQHPYWSHSYLFPPEDSSFPPPSPQNRYDCSFLTTGSGPRKAGSFSYRIQPGEGLHGGRLRPFPDLDPISRCVRLECCTFQVTKKNHAQQKWYHCMDCSNLDSNCGCCSTCAQKCHAARGHRVEEASRSPSRFYCDCGEGQTEMVAGGELIYCSIASRTLDQGAEEFLRVHGRGMHLPYKVRIVCNGCDKPKNVSVFPDQRNRYLVREICLLDGIIRFPALQESTFPPPPVFATEMAPFDTVPSSVEEFVALRSACEARVAEETPPEILTYRQACLGVAFYSLGLLVCVRKGDAVGADCLAHCFDSKFLVPRSPKKEIKSAFLRRILTNLKPFMAMSYVRAPEGSLVPSPYPANAYSYDLDSGLSFVYEVGPGAGAWGGRKTPLEQMGPITRCHQAGCCTFHVTGTRHANQEWFNCLTCPSLKTNCGVCRVCAQQCHAALGHTVVRNKVSRFYCDCGEGGTEMREGIGGRIITCSLTERTPDRVAEEYLHTFREPCPYALPLLCSGCEVPKEVLVKPGENGQYVVEKLCLVDNDIKKPAMILSDLDEECPELADQEVPPRLIEVRQWVRSVNAFSSEYSVHHGASTLIGSPRVFPKHGDIVGTWAMKVKSDCEFVECEFECPVALERIRILETLKPGAITGIYVRRCGWSGNPVRHWIQVHQSEVETGLPRESRAFEPELRLPEPPKALVTRFVRVELDVTVQGLWSEIDSIELIGRADARLFPDPEAFVGGETLSQPVAAVLGCSSEYGGSYGTKNVVGKTSAEGEGWWSKARDERPSIDVRYQFKVIPTQLEVGWPAKEWASYRRVPLIEVFLLSPTSGWVSAWSGRLEPRGQQVVPLRPAEPVGPIDSVRLLYAPAQNSYAVIERIVLVGGTPIEREPNVIPVSQPVSRIRACSTQYNASWGPENVLGKTEPVAEGWWSAGQDDEPFIEVEYERLVSATHLDVGWPSKIWPGYARVPLVEVRVLNEDSEWVEAWSGKLEPMGEHSLPLLTGPGRTNVVKLVFAPAHGHYAVMEKIVLVGTL